MNDLDSSLIHDAVIVEEEPKRKWFFGLFFLLILFVGCSEEPVPKDVAYVTVDQIASDTIQQEVTLEELNLSPCLVFNFSLEVDEVLGVDFLLWNNLGMQDFTNLDYYSGVEIKETRQLLTLNELRLLEFKGTNSKECIKERKIYQPTYNGSRIEYIEEKSIIDKSDCVKRNYTLMFFLYEPRDCEE